jgi:nitroreductase
MGIGSCWVAGDKKDYCWPVAELLNASEGIMLVSLVALGYPFRDGAFTLAQKRQLGELLHWEKF